VPLPDPVRNWGSCYRFHLGGWSCAILVDSGVDAGGSVVDALRRSVEEHGPVDIVMSCCFPFLEGINRGLPMHALAVPFDELRRLFNHAESITSGPDGVARACAAAQARWFLPYAHGFSGLHRDPVDAEVDMSEHDVLVQVREAFALHGTPTEILQWSPGDVLRWRDGRPSVERPG
jgi:hypothetical protein